MTKTHTQSPGTRRSATLLKCWRETRDITDLNFASYTVQIDGKGSVYGDNKNGRNLYLTEEGRGDNKHGHNHYSIDMNSPSEMTERGVRDQGPTNCFFAHLP